MLVALVATVVLAAPVAEVRPVGVVAEAAPPELLGPLPVGTTFHGVEEHAEYVRYNLRTDRAFVVEVTPRRGGSPICDGGGVDLWVRLDLSEAAEDFVWDPLPRIVTQMCDRLAAHAPVFGRPLANDASVPAPPQARAAAEKQPPAVWPWRPLHAVVVPFLALCLWLLPRDRVALGAGLLALLVRVGLSPQTVLLGGDAAYERLLRARGYWDPDPYYGGTWPALMGLLGRAAGSPDHFVHTLNIGFSALTVMFTVALARRVGASAWGAAAAGALLALHPLAVALAGMEDTFVLVGLLQVVAVMAAVGDRSGPRAPLDAWTAALAVGLLVHLRPEQGAFALVPLALLAWRRDWAPLALGLALCAWRAVEILGMAGEVGHGAKILDWGRWATPSFLRALLAPGPLHPAVLLDPLRSPAAFVLLAAVGAFGARHPAGRRLLVPVAALLVPLAVVITKTLPLADPARFQLPGLAFAAVLAGVGLASFATRRAWLLAWGAGLVLTTLVAKRPLEGGWAWAHEYQFLRAHLRDMPEDTLVLYRPDQDPHFHFNTWVDGVSPGRWRPLGSVESPPVTGAWYWRGFADGVDGVWPPMPCALEPISVTEVPSRTDGWIVLPPGPLAVGFYRVGVCAAENTF